MHPDDTDNQIRHETLYTAIYAHPRGSLKQGMVDILRQRKPAYGRRRSTLAKGQTIPEALRMVHRPEAISQRLLPGHCPPVAAVSLQAQLNDIARLPNGRPRQTLGWKTPDEVMSEEAAEFSKRAALGSCDYPHHFRLMVVLRNR